jgi:hypothetical protein
MMNDALSGNLSSLRLIDVLRILNENVKTGRLHLTNHHDSGEIYFQNGEIVHAVYQEKIGEDAIYAMLAWSTGDFIFSPHITIENKSFAISTTEVLVRGDSIDKEWESVRDVVSSSDMVFSLSMNSLADVRLNALEWAVLREINGSTTVLAISEKLGCGELEVSKIARKLFLVGLIEIAGQPQLQPPRHGSNVDSMILKDIEGELTKRIGPIAAIILDEYLEKMGETREGFPKERMAELAEYLSQEILDAPRRVSFQQTMVELLKKI